MVSLKLAALLTITALVAFASSAVVTPTYDVTRESDADENSTVIITPVFDENEDKGDDGNEAEIDGIPLKYLTEQELKDLLDDEDDILVNELDISVARKIVKARKDRRVGVSDGLTTGARQKRWIPIAARLFVSAGRALFRGAVRAPKPTQVGSRVTQQYIRPGNYNDANRYFNSFRPDNVSSFTNRGISGRTGTVGNHRFTVRDGSKQGSPTLEIRSPKPDGTYVRKIRFQD